MRDGCCGISEGRLSKRHEIKGHTARKKCRDALQAAVAQVNSRYELDKMSGEVIGSATTSTTTIEIRS